VSRAIRDANVDKLGEVFQRLACGRMVEDRKARLEAQWEREQARLEQLER
jgi:hypothetical protein